MAKAVSVAATGGTPRDLLVAMRDRIAQAVDDPETSARDLAALTRRLMEIAKEIEVIDHAANGGDPVSVAAQEPDAPL
ncbi:hypothetical protein [Mycobacteroides abscessus]|uniref:hypothetical protein n=1 Tax=Mycobacteroides abscessus TaxID=36809 RepID=UPI00092C5C0D|nr:hypothetical protein [Mycobacteroides abscessus]SKS05253.1 gp8 domain protein [Mycobacteroides abscessus subsp. abscessus]SHU54235.1 gp8 domain protein [Mycobacteroides abscessus subsp. bolletii]SHW62888.1 gp8 domain protein [Mycobacteroides abscessus subsp. bolletii]SHW90891.1 gp8 domain protein [Mycobacteroides abscessus subsp. bolletii]SHX34429.1 gp8 domain protein [Mycobacteroides abscessus subsp. bolletii]